MMLVLTVWWKTILRKFRYGEFSILEILECRITYKDKAFTYIYIYIYMHISQIHTVLAHDIYDTYHVMYGHHPITSFHQYWVHVSYIYVYKYVYFQVLKRTQHYADASRWGLMPRKQRLNDQRVGESFVDWYYWNWHSGIECICGWL